MRCVWQNKRADKKGMVMNLDEAIKLFELNLNYDLKSLKSQFRKMVLKYHPDKNNGDSTKFLQIKEAYDVLLMELQRRNSPTRTYYPYQMIFGQDSTCSDTFNWTWSFNG